jgi:hypothetical protein
MNNYQNTTGPRIEEPELPTRWTQKHGKMAAVGAAFESGLGCRLIFGCPIT